jgi:hypothetical protein
VKGQLVGVLSQTTVTVTYFQPPAGQATANLYLPIDNDTCVRSVQVRFADKKIDFQVRRKEEASAEFQTACTSGKTACVMNLSEKRVTKMEIGNIPGQSNFIVEYQVTVLASSYDNSAIFLKLPLESCNPSGMMISIGSGSVQQFEAIFDLAQFGPIQEVFSNFAGQWRADEALKTGCYSFCGPTSGSSLVLSVRFAGPLDVSLFPVAFGSICTLPVFPRLPEDEPTLKLEYFFVLDWIISATKQRQLPTVIGNRNKDSTKVRISQRTWF